MNDLYGQKSPKESGVLYPEYALMLKGEGAKGELSLHPYRAYLPIASQNLGMGQCIHRKQHAVEVLHH